MSNFGAAAGAEAVAESLAALKIEAVGVAVVVEAVDFCELLSMAAIGEEETVETAADVVSVGLAGPAGEEKKEVMEALALGFLAVEVARSAALRLSGVAIDTEGLIWESAKICQEGRSESESRVT